MRSSTYPVTNVSAADQHMLTDYFHQVLREELGKKFALADQAGPGVMQLQVALTDVEGATRGLRTISMLWPQARVLNTLKYAATGTYAFIGGAQTEVKLTDAVSGQVLTEGMDKRIGGGSLEAAMQWQWGDAENATVACEDVGAGLSLLADLDYLAPSALSAGVEGGRPKVTYLVNPRSLT